ncbi:MAG UNVERIFIED_CONTAM: hypothetical protein LVR18_05325 [Planctomycetaceae bacterium]
MKDIQWRAVDVDRPVTHSCGALDAALAARLDTVTGGLTSSARLRPTAAIPACKARSTSPG